MIKNRVLFLSIAGLLAACGTHHVMQPTQPDDKASVMLAEAANSVSRSLVELTRIEKSVLPKDKILVDSYALDLRGTVSIDWSGPIEPVLVRLADKMHYKLRRLGPNPPIPIVVTVSAYNAPLGSLFRDLDFQAGHRADILVFPQTKTVEIRYAKL